MNTDILFRPITLASLRRPAAIAVIVYILALFGSYLLLGQAQSEWRTVNVYWETAVTISDDLVQAESAFDDAANSDDDRNEAGDPASERPQASGFDGPARTHSIAVWQVLGTWLDVRADTHAMQMEALSHLDYVHGELDTQSRPDTRYSNH